MNYKKQMGEALKEQKAADWYKELPKDLQKIADEQTIEFFAPLNTMQNALTNIYINTNGLSEKWEAQAREHYGWADPSKTLGDVSVLKKRFVTENMAGAL